MIFNFLSGFLICVMLNLTFAVNGENITESEETTLNDIEETTRTTLTTETTTVDIMETRCPPYQNIHLSQSELFKRLVDPCRFDKIQRPPNYDKDGNSIPVEVFIRAYVFYMQNLDTHNLQFTLQMRFQIRYFDQRLIFSKVATNRTDPIIGEEDLRKDLWLPHIFFVNEEKLSVLGTQSRDIITTIHHDGTVIISSRFQVSLYCSMEFKKFPLDQQKCKLIVGNWIYNTSNVKLHWEQNSPFTMGSDKILTEYTISNTSLDEIEIDSTTEGLQYGDFKGKYSSLVFTITLDRFLGYYLLDYYFPSMMLVAISWVSFWLQADQTSPRAMLGTSAMLTFITLSASQTKALPKVSYIKASEIWFVGCALFIFGSLIEFAFVNLLWRRTKNVVVKKVTTANLLKKTLTPNMMRKNYNSDSSIKTDQESSASKVFDQSLSSSNFPAYVNQTSTDTMDDMSDKSIVDIFIEVPSRNTDHKTDNNNEDNHKVLTHQEIAILLDKRARLVFPCAFLVFNVFYWILVYI